MQLGGRIGGFGFKALRFGLGSSDCPFEVQGARPRQPQAINLPNDNRPGPLLQLLK